jgi:heme oxygenase
MHSPAAAASLSSRLREGTRAMHVRAERASFIQALFGGRLDSAGYALMLRNLHPIYCALETGLRTHAQHAAIQPILEPALFRCDALGDDLQALHGPGWAHALAWTPAAQAYAQRLDTLTSAEPALLVAHAYVRYLGDLNGGQMFARLVARLPGSAERPAAGALRFHDFGAPAEVARLAGALRRGLDALDADEGLAQRIVVEATHAFERHVVLFDELAFALETQPQADALSTAPLSPGR